MDPTETEGLDLHHIAPLGEDTIPDQNQAHYCMSCEFPMQGLYCVQCGQKNDDYRRSVFTLAKELITSITAIESRIWRTWATLLFKPGKVAREFSNGRRVHWSSPIRIYLAMSILLFGYMGLTNTHIISLDIDAKVKDGIEKPIDELLPADIQTKFNVHAFETQSRINARNADRNFALIQKKLSGNVGQLNFNLSPTGITTTQTEAEIETLKNEGKKMLEELGVEAPEDVQKVLNEIDTAIDDAAENEDGSETDKSGVTVNGMDVEPDDWIDFTTRFMKNPAVMTQSFNKWLPRLMFFMMPFTMLIGAMFIRGRGNAILYDHLVHAAYIHAVAFFLLFVGILLSRFIDGNAVANLIFVILLIYLPLSLKRMFARGWIKTIWTAYGVGMIYFFFISIAMISLMLRDISSTFFSTL